MKDRTIFGGNKILRHLENIIEYKNKGFTSPITMEIDPTNYCSHKCPKCTGYNQNKVYLTRQEAEDYVKQIKDYGTKGLIFSGGGEPLLNSSTVDVIKYANNLGIDVGLITNGTLLTKEKGRELLDYCKWIRISLDAGTPEVYMDTHGLTENYFKQVLINIKNLTAIRNDIKSKTTIGVGFLTGEKTKKNMVAFASLSSQLGVDYAQFRPFHLDNTDITDEIEKCKQFEKDGFKILASTQKYSHFGEKFKRDYTYCHGANFVGVIQADANMTLCCHTRGNPNFYIGNLREQSFKDIWEGEKKKELLSQLDVSKCIPYCRADGFTRTITDIMTEKEHENFL